MKTKLKRLLNRVLNHYGYTIAAKHSKDTSFDQLRLGQDLSALLVKTEGFISLEEAALLYELAKATTDNCIVEVGSYRGRSTVALGRGSIDGHQVPVFAVDPHEQFAGNLVQYGPSDRGAFYRAMLDSGCYHVVRLINLSSEVFTQGWERKVDLLWLDGDHSHTGVKRDFDCWAPHLTIGARIAFDDSKNPALGPKQVIDELIATDNFELVHEVGKVTVLRRK